MAPPRALPAALLAAALACAPRSSGAVRAAPQPLAAHPLLLTFSAQQGLAAIGQSVPLAARDGAAAPDAAVFYGSEGGWLLAGIARDGGRDVLSVQPVAHQLGPGVYRATVVVRGAEPQHVQVQLFVRAQSATGCPPASTLRYAGGGGRGEPADFGQTFFAHYCVRCHGSALRGLLRSGAPSDLNWDTHEAVRTHRTWIDAVASREAAQWPDTHAAGLVMPPRGVQPRPTDDERDLLARWIACGAP